MNGAPAKEISAEKPQESVWLDVQEDIDKKEKEYDKTLEEVDEDKKKLKKNIPLPTKDDILESVKSHKGPLREQIEGIQKEILEKKRKLKKVRVRHSHKTKSKTKAVKKKSSSKKKSSK